MHDKIFFWVDERNEVGKLAVTIMRGSGLDYVIIPMDKGLPFATRGRAKFNGIEELKVMVATFSNKG